MVRQFGKEKCKVKNIEYEFYGIKYKGKRLTVRIGDTGFIQNALLIPSQDKSRMLVLQDALPEDKQSTQETELAMKLLKESFKINDVSNSMLHSGS